MELRIFPSKMELGRAAAEAGGERLAAALTERATVGIILATGASQFEALAHLAKRPGIDWSRVHAYHLDEYVGLPDTHAASFRRFLRERFVDRLATPLGSFTFINPDDDPVREVGRLNQLMEHVIIDVAFLGIGENGHLAFNDPPADFQLEQAYHVVNLDEACRRQQLGEGWFTSLDEVPTRAISMTIRQILRSRSLIVSASDRRKAAAVAASVEGPITPNVPASILRDHADCLLFLDHEAASRLDGGIITAPAEA